MSADKVIPIRPGAVAPPATTPKVRARRKRPSRAATAKQILAVVDRYQYPLLNLESAIRCIKAKAQEDECDGLVGALELVEQELARISEALEPGMIVCAIERQRREKADSD